MSVTAKKKKTMILKSLGNIIFSISQITVWRSPGRCLMNTVSYDFFPSKLFMLQ